MFLNSIITWKEVLLVGGSVGITVVGMATDVVGVGAIVVMEIDEGVEVEVRSARMDISSLIFGQNN